MSYEVWLKKRIKKPNEIKDYLPVCTNTTNYHLTQIAASWLSIIALLSKEFLSTWGQRTCFPPASKFKALYNTFVIKWHVKKCRVNLSFFLGQWVRVTILFFLPGLSHLTVFAYSVEVFLSVTFCFQGMVFCATANSLHITK